MVFPSNGSRMNPPSWVRYALFLLGVLSSRVSGLTQKKINPLTALCNDGSPAVMYVSEGTRCSSSINWLIFFEGGGGCTNVEQCVSRLDQSLQAFSSSTNLPPRIIGRDILSSNRSENRHFYSYCHVLVPYCSSDYWLGTVANYLMAGRNVSFLGSQIFKSAISNLLGIGLGNASDVVLFGVSAGSIGILNHMNWLQAMLPKVSLSLVLDSGLFVNYNNVFRHLYFVDLADQFLSTFPLCQQKDEFGVPFCLLPSCFLLNYRSNFTLPRILFISSMYDSYLLNFVLQDVSADRQTASTSGESSAFITRSINEVYAYGSFIQSRASLLHCTIPQVSVVMPSCTQHYFTASSSLWDTGGLLSNVFLQTTGFSTSIREAITVRNEVDPGTWNSIKVNGTTIQDYIGLWKQGGNSSIFVTDTCSSLFCSDGCQDLVNLATNDFRLTEWWEWLLFAVAIVLVCGPVGPKIALLVQQKRLFWSQSRYIQKRDSHLLNKQGSLFASVSCCGLTYRPYSSLNVGHKLQHAVLNAVGQCGNYQNFTNRKNNSNCQNSIGTADGLLDRADSSKDRGRIILGEPSSEVREHSTPENRHSEDIIRDVNLYINPGELVAVMGPTGSGKTTLLDVLLGRRSGGLIQGDVFIQGIPLQSMKKWFQSNSGYVRQLAVPYYEELTVRENLVLSANTQMPPNTSTGQLLERVEQVINETNLSTVADFIVGGSTGLGLSGGQKRRLCIALQLVKLPSVLFLDEPTSGLDAASSKELLTILNLLSHGGRSVFLTIHQPRVEIFHMFHKIVLLSSGQVTYFGSPFDALAYFKQTLVDNSVPVKLNDAVSPADALLDLLTHKENQTILIDAYKNSGQPQAVSGAVLQARQPHANSPTATHIQNPGFWRRLMTLELRASLRQSWIQVVYIPMVFTVVAALISTIYQPPDVGTKIVAVVCLTSCCSSLLMSSMVMGLLLQPLKIFTLEYSDGISKPQDLILQVFLRMASISAVPLTLCMTVITLSVYQPQNAHTVVFAIIVFLLVNLCWVNTFILITVTFPSLTHRICPLVAALGSFFCGFIIPRQHMQFYYVWILYLDPSYYAFSATSVAIFRSWRFCHNDHVECFSESGSTYIALFGLDDVNPIVHLVVLICFVVVLLLSSILMLKLRMEFHNISSGLWNLINSCRKSSRTVSPELTDTGTVPNYSSPLSPSGDHSLKEEHKVHHTFHGWRADTDDISDNKNPNSHQQHQSSVHDASRETRQSGGSVKGDADYEVIDMQQSTQQQFLQLMLKRRTKMEQALVSVNRSAAVGDWLCTDSETNLVSMDDVGYKGAERRPIIASSKGTAKANLEAVQPGRHSETCNAALVGDSVRNRKDSLLYFNASEYSLSLSESALLTDRDEGTDSL